MNETISLRDVWAELAAYDPSIWLGLLAAVMIFIVEIILLKKGLILSSGIKEFERARRTGHSVIAEQVSCRYRDRENRAGSRDRIYIARYQYEYNGTVKQKQIISTSAIPPDSITLYFLPSSNKPLCEYDRKADVFFPLIYIIPVLSAVLIVYFCGR